MQVHQIEGAGALSTSPGIEAAAACLRAGGLALLPTETVYGIGVSIAAFPGDELPAIDTGYRRIFTLKRRDTAQTVPWLVAGPEALDEYGEEVDVRARALAEAFWPGALTIIVKASSAVPAFMRAADGTVGLRASADPAIQALIAACASPLAVTSANTHGAPAPTAFSGVEPCVLAGVDVALDAGATVCRDASTIVSFTTGELRILRQGAISAARVKAALAAERTESRAARPARR